MVLCRLFLKLANVQVSEKTGLLFDLRMRSSMHVDAYHITSDTKKMKAIDEALTKRGIFGSFTF